MDILGLLKRIEWGDYSVCPDCDTWKYNSTSGDVNQHDKDCELKAAINALEAGRLVVVEIGKRYNFTTTMNGELVEVEKCKEQGI